MIKVDAKDITIKVSSLLAKIGVTMEKNTLNLLKKASEEEENSVTKFALDIMVKNALVACDTNTPLCQDTGMVVAFVTIGQNVVIENGFIADAINEGVRIAYKENYFRKSVLDPISRKNTLDNTPAVIHYNLVQEDILKIEIMQKGFGSENMSKLYMLTPAVGIEGIKKCIIDTVKLGGGNPCPPVCVGVGIGGTMEKACLMSKHALTRDTSSKNADEELNALEVELLDSINSLGIGAQGFGGKLTALKVFIEKYPTHLAGLPVAVTIQCHAVRHGEVVIC